MRISKLRLLDRMRRIRLDHPLYSGGDRALDYALRSGLATVRHVPQGRRLMLTEAGAQLLSEMGESEAHGNLSGCWTLDMPMEGLIGMMPGPDINTG